jgi:hypothetical protein
VTNPIYNSAIVSHWLAVAAHDTDVRCALKNLCAHFVSEAVGKGKRDD